MTNQKSEFIHKTLEKNYNHQRRTPITHHYRMDETELVNQLKVLAKLSPSQEKTISQTAYHFVKAVREQKQSGVDNLLAKYDLSSEEGVALMCLAEALLRVPDKATLDELIKDKVSSKNWQQHLSDSDSMFVNAATWGLILTGKIMTKKTDKVSLTASLLSATKRLGEPVIHQAIKKSMALLSEQFVLGERIQSALKIAKKTQKKGYYYSYDMLGEAARTRQQANDYFQAYTDAIDAIGQTNHQNDVIKSPGISVKLSALFPRYEFTQRDNVLRETIPRLLALCEQAKHYHLGLTVDAEEADRLDLMLDLIEAMLKAPSLAGWDGLGLAVQAYQKRCLPVIDWLAQTARQYQRKLMVRLVKGAYWDTEIKHSQVMGFEGYPVFTRKCSTDISYVAAAKKLFEYADVIYSQFATHNAYTVSTILTIADDKPFEFQRLHGMGEALYDEVTQASKVPCRIYAPVGAHEYLLAYLVRRLLENGANTSFINRLFDKSTPISELIENPETTLSQYADIPHPKIPLPENIYPKNRKNSRGLDLSNRQTQKALTSSLTQYSGKDYHVYSLGKNIAEKTGAKQVLVSPGLSTKKVSDVYLADSTLVVPALNDAHKAFESWVATPVGKRAQMLFKMADLLEENRDEFLYLLIREAGKTLTAAIAEIREAVDFCRYYALQAEQLMANSKPLPGPTGEDNYLTYHGRGVFICISPWNFPLAIFLGQITAALATGNCVLAKPAQQTPTIAFRAVELLYQSGVPKDVCQLFIGQGRSLGQFLVEQEKIAGVLFTGSNQTANSINQSLANRKGAIVPFIAETGGQNVMIVDSTALPEQTIMDIIRSSFDSAGQRCSALRVLYLQEDIAPRFIDMLQGAMAELTVDNPGYLSTDIGPVIDKAAKKRLLAHIQRMQNEGKLIAQTPLSHTDGYFVPPTAIEINSITQLDEEIFGPILHVVRYAKKDLEKVINDINSTGFGLTFGLHSRLESTTSTIAEKINAGNLYINRDMIGAVVGVQPFGGEGLSGTGPKAGGPHYLQRLITERTFSINTTALGGNASLLALHDADLKNAF